MLKLFNSFALRASDESIRGAAVFGRFNALDVSMMLAVVSSHYLFPTKINNRQAG
jgi:hypothetical protein